MERRADKTFGTKRQFIRVITHKPQNFHPMKKYFSGSNISQRVRGTSNTNCMLTYSSSTLSPEINHGKSMGKWPC